jgi:hypothetical protein
MLPTKLEEMSVEDFGVIDGYEVVSSDGHSLGNIDMIFAEISTGKPEWLGLWGGVPFSHRHIVPIQGAERDATTIRVPFTKDVVKQAPSYHEGILDKGKHVHITPDQEEAAFALYGLEHPGPTDDGSARLRATSPAS